MPTDKFRQKHPKNRKTKTHLLFDEENRRDFLSGFQKRKKERKRVAREQQLLKYKEEKLKLRHDTRKARQAGWKELNFPDEDTEVKDREPIVYDHAEHTVTVESVGGVTVEALDLLAAHGGIGENKVVYEDNDDDVESAQSRLKGLAEYNDDDDDDDDKSRSDEDNNGDVPEERKAKDKKNPVNKKSLKLRKLQSKLNKSKTGHRGGASSARHKGGHKGGQKGGQSGPASRGVKGPGHRGKKQRGNKQGGYGGKRR